MASTSQLRASYPEFITDPTRPSCDFSGSVPVVFYAGPPGYPGGRITLRVHPLARQIFRVQAAIMLHHRYPFRESAGGTLSCRRITGGTGTTLHAHGVAKDDNPSVNGYRHQTGPIQWGRHTDMPMEMVRDIEAVRLTNGLRPLEWGGRWTNIKDPMHWELDVLRSQLQPVNLATLPAGAWAAYLAFEAGTAPETGEDPMLNLSLGTSGTAVRGPEVVALQLMLTRRGHNAGTPDGIAGNTTRAALRSFQDAAQIHDPERGEYRVGPYTYAALFAPSSSTGGVDAAQLNAAIATHASVPAGTGIHPHRHDEGVTGGATT